MDVYGCDERDIVLSQFGWGVDRGTGYSGQAGKYGNHRTDVPRSTVDCVGTLLRKKVYHAPTSRNVSS